MAEQHDLTTPIPTRGGTSFWEIQHLVLHHDGDESYIKVGLVGENAERVSTGWQGAEATTLIRALNTANLSAKSLQRRVLERLATDGLLAPGSISGTPDA